MGNGSYKTLNSTRECILVGIHGFGLELVTGDL